MSDYDRQYVAGQSTLWWVPMAPWQIGMGYRGCRRECRLHLKKGCSIGLCHHWLLVQCLPQPTVALNLIHRISGLGYPFWDVLTNLVQRGPYEIVDGASTIVGEVAHAAILSVIGGSRSILLKTRCCHFPIWQLSILESLRSIKLLRP